MIVLALDTAFDACSAALVRDGGVLWSERRIIGKGHSEALPPMIAAGLANAGVSPAAIDRIGVVIGPGAFAGVRVGLAFARGFRIGLSADVVGVTSTEALAASLPPFAGRTAIVYDARRGQVYAAVYDAAMTETAPPFVADPASAARRIAETLEGQTLRLAGSGAPLLPMRQAYERDETLHADPVAIAERAALRPAAPGLPAPLYLRPPDATPAAGGLLLAAPES